MQMTAEIRKDVIVDEGDRDVHDDVPDDVNCIRKVPFIQSVVSAMLTTMYIQMGITLVAGILIHILAGMLMNIEDAMTQVLVVLGVFMYMSVIEAFIFVAKLPPTDSKPFPSPTDPAAIVQIFMAYNTEKTRILRCFLCYNTVCCYGSACWAFIFIVALAVLSAVAWYADKAKWAVSLGLIAFVPLVAFAIYNYRMSGKYEDKLEKFNIVNDMIRRETLPGHAINLQPCMAEVETVMSEALSKKSNSTVPGSAPAFTLDTILQKKLES